MPAQPASSAQKPAAASEGKSKERSKEAARHQRVWSEKWRTGLPTRSATRVENDPSRVVGCGMGTFWRPGINKENLISLHRNALRELYMTNCS